MFVTGGHGFLGGWMLRTLAGLGSRVVYLEHESTRHTLEPSVEFAASARAVRGDTRDGATIANALAEFEIDTVFHLAAKSIVGAAKLNPVETLEVNVAGTWTILEACRRSPHVKHMVLASSDKAYGSAGEPPFTEESPLAGRFPYDASKSCVDLVGQMYATTFGLPILITRCANFFGGGDPNFNRIVPGTIRSVLSGERPVIRSDGRYVRDYLYIEDAVSAYLWAVEQLNGRPELAGEAFNFSSELRVSVIDMVQQVIRLMKSDLEPFVLNNVSHEVRESYLSAEKARRVLGWKPRFSLEEGLLRTIDWYAQRFGASARP